MDWKYILLAAVCAAVCAAIAALITYRSAQSKTNARVIAAEAKIDEANRSADRIVAEATRNAENAKKEAVLSAKEEILQLKQQFEESSSRSFSGSHYIHLGIEHTIARAILPRVLPAFLREHPDTFLKLSEESPDVMQKSISYDGVDLVIGSLGSVPEKFEAIPLCRKDHLLVVPKALMAELAGERLPELRERFSESADLSFFEKAPFIKIPRQSSGGRALSSYLKYYDINPRFVCELTNIENAFQLSNGGLGVFIYAKIFWDTMAPEIREDYLKNIYVFPLPYLPDIDDVCAYYNRDNGLHGMTLELFKVIRDFLAAYDPGPEKG